MNCKTSCFNLADFSISMPLIKENFKRFWAVPVFSFLVYFFSGPFLILMEYNDLSNFAAYISDMLQNYNLFFMATHLLCPVVSALLVFRYLQGNSSVTMMHSMPFTRSMLFHSNYISGFLFSALPILANALLLFLMRKPVYNTTDAVSAEITSSNIPSMEPLIEKIDLFTNAAILQWMLSSLLIVLFLYTISVFAGTITGSSITHFIGALGFNFICPLVYLCILLYCNEYLYGFSYQGFSHSLIYKMSPYLYILIGRPFTWGIVLWFLALTLIILLLAKFLYGIRAMERATEALTFRFMEPVVCYLFALLGMTGMHFYFSSLHQGSLAFGYLGFAVGGILSFFIGRMLIKKSFRVFNFKSLKSLSICTLSAVLLISGLQFDVFGYETKVPELNAISKISFSPQILLYNAYRGSIANLITQDYHSEEALSAISDFHKEIITNKETFQQEKEKVSTNYMKFSYQLHEKSSLTRTYEQIPNSYLRKSPALDAWLHSTEAKEKLKSSLSKLKNANFATLYSQEINHEDTTNKKLYPNEYDLNGLVEAITQDLENQSLKEASMSKISLSQILFDCNSSHGTTHVSVTADMKHTLSWFSKNKLDSYLGKQMKNIAYITVEHRYDSNTIETPEPVITGDFLPIPTSPDIYLLQDSDQYGPLLANCEGEALNYNDFYQVTLAHFIASTRTAYYDTYYIHPDSFPPELAEFFKKDFTTSKGI